MKIYFSFLTLAFLAVTVGGVKLVQSKLEQAQQGTSVIVVKDEVKKGGQPYTVTLPRNLTSRQAYLLSFAYRVAKEDGHHSPELVQGMIMQETKAGNMAGWRVAGLENRPGDRYFGVGQVKLVAAKEVLRTYPKLWKHLDTRTDEELQARLIVDDEFNIRVASKYLLLVGVNTNATIGVTAYNRGPTGAQEVNPHTHNYTVRVKEFANSFKQAQRK